MHLANRAQQLRLSHNRILLHQVRFWCNDVYAMNIRRRNYASASEIDVRSQHQSHVACLVFAVTLRRPLGCLREDVLNDSAVDVRESKVSTLIAVRQAFVIDAQLMKDGCLQVVDVNRIFDHVDAVIVRFAVRHSGFDSATSQPVCKAIRMMITSVVVPAPVYLDSKLFDQIPRPRRPVCLPAMPRCLRSFNRAAVA